MSDLDRIEMAIRRARDAVNHAFDVLLAEVRPTPPAGFNAPELLSAIFARYSPAQDEAETAAFLKDLRQEAD